MGHQRYDYDVLIIGAGGAGLRATIEAAKPGVSVGLVCKSLLGKAHTVMAGVASRPRSPTSTIATTGACTSRTRCAAVST
jgi:alkyl hydroperoxide reductase subunit AhpF